MSFSPSWLALREPVDHRSLNVNLKEILVSHFKSVENLHIIDLGAGTGSNYRALAPLFPHATWTLVDYDGVLLTEAKKLNGENNITYLQADLTKDLDKIIALKPDLFSAAALFDLISKPWIDKFAQKCAAKKIPLYTTLIYNGLETWQPKHMLDKAIFKAFHAHQQGDKGFGKACGPQAGAVLERAFKQYGYSVQRAPSPWVMRSEKELMQELSKGYANAVRETGQVIDYQVNLWLEAALKAQSIEIGHDDFLALI